MTNSKTGESIWKKPAALGDEDVKQLDATDFSSGTYNGDFGLNGFHLTFKDSNNLGFDSSGKKNHFLMYTKDGGTSPAFDTTMRVPGSLFVLEMNYIQVLVD
jgi:hypothetical protein